MILANKHQIHVEGDEENRIEKSKKIWVLESSDDGDAIGIWVHGGDFWAGSIFQWLFLNLRERNMRDLR